MRKHNVTILSPYPFKVGQKLFINKGRRRGDWEVVAINENKVRLKCPISLKECEFDRFCYIVKEEKEVEWPTKE